MKITINLIAFIFFVHCSFSQVQFEPISFEQALQKSKETGHIIFVQYESASCDQCNEVADKAFEDKILGTQLKEGFIAIKISPKHPDRSNVGNLYNKENFFGTLFITSDGALIHTFPQTASLAQSYVKQIDMALTKASEGLRITEFEKQYRNDPKNIFLIQQLLLLRKDLYLNTDSLLDEYVSLLPADSLRSLAMLSFIAQQYPAIGSNADIILRKDQSLFNEAWYSLSLPVRSGINGHIIQKSMQKAIREKNQEYAYRVASFARSTYSDNPMAGIKVYDLKILDYYKGTHDTLNYLGRVTNYYENYYMTVNVDSIKKADSISLQALLAKQPFEKIKTGDTTLYKKTTTYKGIAQSYTSILNDGAWTICTWTNDPIYLKKALQWAARANEFYESPEAMDTYARLLYKTGNSNEAIQEELKAIDLKQKRGYKTTALEIVLSNMKAGKTVIDN